MDKCIGSVWGVQTENGKQAREAVSKRHNLTGLNLEYY